MAVRRLDVAAGGGDPRAEPWVAVDAQVAVDVHGALEVVARDEPRVRRLRVDEPLVVSEGLRRHDRAHLPHRAVVGARREHRELGEPAQARGHVRHGEAVAAGVEGLVTGASADRIDERVVVVDPAQPYARSLEAALGEPERVRAVGAVLDDVRLPGAQPEQRNPQEENGCHDSHYDDEDAAAVAGKVACHAAYGRQHARRGSDTAVRMNHVFLPGRGCPPGRR